MPTTANKKEYYRTLLAKDRHYEGVFMDLPVEYCKCTGKISIILNSYP